MTTIYQFTSEGVQVTIAKVNAKTAWVSLVDQEDQHEVVVSKDFILSLADRLRPQ